LYLKNESTKKANSLTANKTRQALELANAEQLRGKAEEAAAAALAEKLK